MKVKRIWARIAVLALVVSVMMSFVLGCTPSESKVVTLPAAYRCLIRVESDGSVNKYDFEIGPLKYWVKEYVNNSMGFLVFSEYYVSRRYAGFAESTYVESEKSIPVARVMSITTKDEFGEWR